MEKEQDIDIEHFLTKKNKKCIKVINKFLNNKIKNEDKNRITLQVIEDLKSNNKTFQKVILDLKSNQYSWNHSCFSDSHFNETEILEYLIKPFEVEEGVLCCIKCKSKRSYSYQKQTRSADEPMSTFATCANCGYSWKYSG